MTTETDAARPQLILGDNTAGTTGIWELADTDSGPPMERRWWFYITDGSASDLPATIDIANQGDRIEERQSRPAVNFWERHEIRAAPMPIPNGASVTINYEYFSSPHGEQPIHWRLVMARLKEVRPDLKLAMYQTSPFKNSAQFEAMHKDDVDALCLTVYPSRWMEHNLRHIERLVAAMRTRSISEWWQDIPLTIATGWEPQDRPGETTSDKVIEDRLHHIARELKRMGIYSVDVWDNPPKPGVIGRDIPKAMRAAEIIAEVYRDDATPCKECHGDGTVEGFDGEIGCDHCDDTGIEPDATPVTGVDGEV